MHADSNMWLYHLLLRGWLHLGQDEWTVRLLSALFAVVAVPLIGMVASTLWGGSAGVVAAFLLAANLFVHYYATEARAYSLVLMLVLLSALCYLRMLEARGVTWWLGFVLSSVASVYAHFFAILVIAVFGVILPFRPADTVDWRRVAGSFLCIALLLLPIPLVAPLVAKLDWLPLPTTADVLKTARRLAGGTYGLVLTLLAAAALGTFARWRDETAMSRWKLAFCWLWLVFPFVFAFIYSHIVRPAFLDRYLIVCIPGLVLLASAGASVFRTAWVPAILVSVFVAQALPGYVHTHSPRPGWREAVSAVERGARSGDQAIVFQHFYLPVVVQYLSDYKPERLLVLPMRLGADIPSVAEADRVWLMLEYDDRFHPGSSAQLSQLEVRLGNEHTAVLDESYGLIRVMRYDRKRAADGR